MYDSRYLGSSPFRDIGFYSLRFGGIGFRLSRNISIIEEFDADISLDWPALARRQKSDGSRELIAADGCDIPSGLGVRCSLDG